jgi:hypothetical protein
MPRPIPKPPQAEEVLAAVAARYPAGAMVTQLRLIGLAVPDRDGGWFRLPDCHEPQLTNIACSD